MDGREVEKGRRNFQVQTGGYIEAGFRKKIANV